MPITFATPPAESVRELHRGVNRTLMFEAGAHVLSALSVQEAALPHQVFSIGLKDLKTGATLIQAKAVSWRYFINTNPSSAVTAEVNIKSPENMHRFAQINMGPVAQSTISALRSILESHEFDKYELRLLRIEALNVSALWLRENSADKNILIPLDPAPSPLEANRRYSEQEFLQIVSAEAKARIDQIEKAGSPTSN